MQQERETGGQGSARKTGIQHLLGTTAMAEFCKQYGLKSVPVVDTAYMLPKTMEEMKMETDGKSEINPKAF